MPHDYECESMYKVMSGRRYAIEGIELVAVAALLMVSFGGGYLFGTTRIPQVLPGTPTQLTISGKFSTTNLGTSASSIQFVSGVTGTAYLAQVSGSQYTLTVPNVDDYTAKIHWNGLFNIGSGDCTAGTLVLRVESSGGPIHANWSC